MSKRLEKKPLVSVIMPTFNSSNTVVESINSVINQTYQNWELLITDDNSSDNTIELINLYSDKRIKVFKNHHNLGAGISRNKSIKESNGDFIAFLDSDDLWDPKKLELQISFMLQNNYALTYTAYNTFDSNGFVGIVTPPKSVTYNELIYSNVIGCLTAIYNAKILGKQYMPEIRKRQDMGLWLKILSKGYEAHGLPGTPLASYRLDSGMTNNKIKILYWQWKFYRTTLRFTRKKTIAIYIKYLYKGVRKTYKSRIRN